MSKHQTVNKKRASAASRYTFWKLHRTLRQNKKRCLSLAWKTSEFRSSGTLTSTHASFFRSRSVFRVVFIFVWFWTLSLWLF